MSDMNKNNFNKLLQIRYHVNSVAGQIIEQFKRNTQAGGTSKVIRELIEITEGYEYFVSNNASHEIIKKQLINEIAFYSSKLEIAKLHYANLNTVANTQPMSNSSELRSELNSGCGTQWSAATRI